MSKRKPPEFGPHYISEHDPSKNDLPPGTIDDSEDMLGDDVLDTDWDGEVEDPPHDRVYAEVDRRAAEAAKTKEKPKRRS